MSDLPLVGFSDPVESVIKFFRSKLDAAHAPLTTGLKVGAKWPVFEQGDPEVFILVRSAGGSQQHSLASARMDLQFWHRTDVECHDLAYLAAAYAHQLRGVDNIRGVRISASPIPIPDTDLSRPHYMATVDLTLRGVPL